MFQKLCSCSMLVLVGFDIMAEFAESGDEWTITSIIVNYLPKFRCLLNIKLNNFDFLLIIYSIYTYVDTKLKIKFLLIEIGEIYEVK